MELGKNSARIVDYGVTKTQKGSMQVFVKLLVGGRDDATWYGMPLKNNGEVNDYMFTQLAYCGFDASAHSLEDLSGGIDSGLMITSEDIDVYVRKETDSKGDEVLRVSTLGTLGPIKIDAEEAKSLLSSEQTAKLKAAGGKFKPRKPSGKPATISVDDVFKQKMTDSDIIPF